MTLKLFNVIFYTYGWIVDHMIMVTVFVVTLSYWLRLLTIRLSQFEN